MKKPHLAFSLYPDIYPINIHVCYSNNESRTLKYFRKKTGDPGINFSHSTIGTAYTSRIGKHILLEFNQELGSHPEVLASMVAHEAVHASWQFEKALGDIFCQDHQEGQTYIVQYITENVLRRIWRYIRKKINGKRKSHKHKKRLKKR